MSLLSNDLYCDVVGCGERTLLGRKRCQEHEGVEKPKARAPPVAPEEKTTQERMMVEKFAVVEPTVEEKHQVKLRAAQLQVTQETEARKYAKKIRSMQAKNYKASQATMLFHKFQADSEAIRLEEERKVIKKTRKKHWSENVEHRVFEVPTPRNPHHEGQAMSSPVHRANRRTWKDNRRAEVREEANERLSWDYNRRQRWREEQKEMRRPQSAPEPVTKKSMRKLLMANQSTSSFLKQASPLAQPEILGMRVRTGSKQDETFRLGDGQGGVRKQSGSATSGEVAVDREGRPRMSWSKLQMKRGPWSGGGMGSKTRASGAAEAGTAATPAATRGGKFASAIRGTRPSVMRAWS
jgi:hypothetical protein